MSKSLDVIPCYKGKGYFARQKEFLTSPLVFSVEKRKEVGDFFYTHLLFKKIFIISNPAVFKHILQTNQKKYKKSPAYDQLKLALGNGLITSEGDFWRKQRRLAQPAFHKEKLLGLFEMMVDVSEKYIDNLRTKCQETSELNMALEMMKVTADIVLKTLFHTENKSDEKKLYDTMSSSQEYIIYCIHHPLRIPWTFVNGQRRRFFNELGEFDDLVQEMIDQRRATDTPPMDLLTMLIETKDADTGEGMTDRQLRDEAMTIYAAGHETSANALSWSLYLLAQHPEVLNRLREEVAQVIGDRRPVFEDLRKLQYTRQVIEESMRLYPPAWSIGREALEEDEIEGQYIPPKGLLFMSIYALHRHPDLWEKPDDFDPDRFEPARAKERSRWHYLPFGAGPRMCIGNNFAMMEMQVLLAMLVRQFDFSLLPGFKVELQPLVTLKPKHGVLMKVVERQLQV